MNNNMNKILTIIVPSYNMESLLDVGLNSLLIDRLDYLDIIVVNDGSKDNTSAIAHRYAELYPNSFTVIDKSNGNYGSCINAGLKIAKGKYIKILDADDSFIKDNFEKFVEELLLIDVDLIITDYVKSYISGNNIYFTYELPQKKVLKIEDIYDSKALYDILLPAITYKTDILKNIGYYQTEGISYTDMEWCFSPMTEVNTIYYFNKCVYNYLMGREGQTMDPEVYKRSIPHRIQCFSALLKSIYGKELKKEIEIFTEKQLIKHAELFYRYFLIDNTKIERSLLEKMDLEFSSLNPSAYLKCGKLKYRLHIPYRYIEMWRKYRNIEIPFYIRSLEKILNVLGKFHVQVIDRWKGLQSVS